MSSDTQYAYAVARIRSIEKKLLDKSGLERMVDARTPEDAMKVIIEAGYGFQGNDALSVSDYEGLLREEEKKLYRLLREVAPEPGIFNMFLLRNDYHNIKVLLKGEFSGRYDEGLLVDTGLIPVNRLSLMIRDRTFSDMNPIMRTAVEECLDTFGRTGDPQVIDLIMDRACFRHIKAAAETSDVRFLKDLAGIMIDLANIRIFIRIKSMKKGRDFLQKFLLPGGSLDGKLFLENLEEPVDSFTNSLKYGSYASLEEGFESYKATGSITKLEKLSDNFVMFFVKKARYTAFGAEPLVGYLMAREHEIKNIRIIMVGKINNISNDLIKERLRETYV